MIRIFLVSRVILPTRAVEIIQKGLPKEQRRAMLAHIRNQRSLGEMVHGALRLVVTAIMIREHLSPRTAQARTMFTIQPILFRFVG